MQTRQTLTVSKSFRWFGVAVLWFGVSVQAESRAPGEWPQWRGPNRDGISTETQLLKEWPEKGPPLLWKANGLGQGYSTVSVSKGRIFTMGSRGDGEFVVALDVIKGKRLWASRHGRRFKHERGNGPRGTPTVDGERLYALGAGGDLSCLDVYTGRIIWSLNVLERFNASNIHWGISESPLVVADRVLINAGGPGASIVALSKKDGSLIWKSQSDQASYSSAVTLEMDGIVQAVFFTGERAVGLDIADGRLLWEYTGVKTRQKIHVATPVVDHNRVFVSADYGVGCGLVELKPMGKGIQVEEVYFNRNMRNHHSSSVLIGGYLYGFSKNILTALHFDDGQVAWRHRSVGKGSLVYAEGHLYCFSEKGVVGLVEANPKEYKGKGRFLIPSGSYPTWTHPVVAGGRLYLRDQDNLYCFDIREKP